MIETSKFLSEDKVESFHRNGYVLGGELISSENISFLQDEVLRVIDDRDREDIAQPLRTQNLSMTKGEGSTVWQIVNIWQASEAFRQIILDSRLGETAAELLNAEEVRLWHDQIQYKPAEVGGVNNWHQDSPYWPCINQGHAVTAWLALDDADEGNGCMRMVNGSHLWGDTIEFLHKEMSDFENPASHYGDHEINVSSATVPKGHVHFHHGFTHHGSSNNRSGRPRRALAMHFISEKTVFLGKKGHPCEELIDVPVGCKIEGEGFPVVYQR